MYPLLSKLSIFSEDLGNYSSKSFENPKNRIEGPKSAKFFSNLTYFI